MTIDQLLAINEEFKKKGLLLSEEDLIDRLRLRDDMNTTSSDIKQEVLIWKLELDKEKAKRTIELKAVKDQSWKNITEKNIDWIIKQEFFEKDIELLTKKATADLLKDRADAIIEFINIIKLNKKISF